MSKTETSALLSEILRLTSRHAVPLDTLAQKAGVSARAINAAITLGNAEGYSLRVVDGYLSSRCPAVKAKGAITLGDTTPGRKHVAIVTDLHFGSLHCNTRALERFLALAWSKGARVCVLTGDILDGNKPVLMHDQSKVGWDGQVGEAVRVFAKATAFEFVAIDGNHDGYFSSSSGLISGQLLQNAMRAAGVDWSFAGVCLGRATIHGAAWHLWHPHGGAGTRNAIRRILNSRIEALEEHAHVVAMGHFHKFATVAAYPENVFGVAGGTFQEKGSEFANRISNGWDVGGTIVSYTVDDKGTPSQFSAEFFPVKGLR